MGRRIKTLRPYVTIRTFLFAGLVILAFVGPSFAACAPNRAVHNRTLCDAVSAFAGRVSLDIGSKNGRWAFLWSDGDPRIVEATANGVRVARRLLSVSLRNITGCAFFSGTFATLDGAIGLRCAGLEWMSVAFPGKPTVKSLIIFDNGTVAFLSAKLVAVYLLNPNVPTLPGFPMVISSPLPDPAVVLASLEKVVDWQLANPPTDLRETADGWAFAVFYISTLVFSRISKSPKRLVNAVKAEAQSRGWKPGPRTYHADDHAIIQAYADLVILGAASKAKLANSVARFDYILANPSIGGLDFTLSDATNRWSWEDSLFMAPRGWIMLSQIMKKPAFLDFAVSKWNETWNYLWNKEQRLVTRDSTFFGAHEPDGAPTFWSRGNGWVAAGTARVLQVLPKSHPARAGMENQFRALVTRLAEIQKSDGLWKLSLLSRNGPQEASGSAFDVYALAWGINNGLIDRTTYLKNVLKGWNGIVSCCIAPNGRVVHVQPPGSGPFSFDPDSSKPYGVGAVLLAGTELYKLLLNR